MKKKIIIACSKRWFTDNEKVKKYLIQNKKTIEIITKKKYLNLKNLNKIQPNIIFFPHWSYLVNEKIVNKFKCICFSIISNSVSKTSMLYLYSQFSG